MEEATLTQVRYALATMLDPRSPPGTAKESSDWLQEFRYRRSKLDAHCIMVAPHMVAILLLLIYRFALYMIEHFGRETIDIPCCGAIL